MNNYDYTTLDQSNRNHYRMKSRSDRSRPPILDQAEDAFVRAYELHTDATYLWLQGKMDTATVREIYHTFLLVSDRFQRVYESWLTGTLVVDRYDDLADVLEAHRDRNDLMGVGVQ